MTPCVIWRGGASPDGIRPGQSPALAQRREEAAAHRHEVPGAGPDRRRRILARPDLVDALEVHEVLLVAAHEPAALLEHAERELGEELARGGHDVHARRARADVLHVGERDELDGLAGEARMRVSGARVAGSAGAGARCRTSFSTVFARRSRATGFRR